MALYELNREALTPIAHTTFAALQLRERSNIQLALRSHITAITPGVKTMVLAEEFGDWVDANRRIDLLCLDEKGRLVIVELKRDQSAHMELQAIRYAAMVSTMRFEQAVEAHRKHLESIKSELDAEKSIRDFLGTEDGPLALSETVRIVLAASDFSTELTTTVLWLNKQGIDIRCVQMRPHSVDNRVLIDIQQVIPLPAAAQYQVALREKNIEQVTARSQQRDTTRYDLTIGDSTFANLPKRKLIYEIVAEAIRRDIKPATIAACIPWREFSMFIKAEGLLNQTEIRNKLPEIDFDRYYTDSPDLFKVDGSTYALSNQWGAKTLDAIKNILEILPGEPTIEFTPTTPVIEEASFGDYLIRQRESGTIEVEKNGTLIQPTKAALREIAVLLNVPQHNIHGNDLNTRTLGVQVIRAISTQ